MQITEHKHKQRDSYPDHNSQVQYEHMILTDEIFIVDSSIVEI